MAPPRVACGERLRKKGEQKLRARGEGQTWGRRNGRGASPGYGSGTQIWSQVLRGGELEEAATAKPPRGAGVRAHVCAGQRGRGGLLGGRRVRARSLAWAHVTGTPIVLPRDREAG